MSTWTNIPDDVLEPGKPIRSVDAIALRDNPVAIAQGAAGAPRVQTAAIQDGAVIASKLATGANEINWVLGRTAGAAAGAVGTYAFLASDNATTVNAGGTKAGSNLRYAGFHVASTSFQGASTAVISGTPAGTWRCMGFDFSTNDPPRRGGTLWLRIS